MERPETQRRGNMPAPLHLSLSVTPGEGKRGARRHIVGGVLPSGGQFGGHEAGLDLSLSPNATAGVSYSGQFGDGVTDNAPSRGASHGCFDARRLPVPTGG
jgi:hypothetical protein